MFVVGAGGWCFCLLVFCVWVVSVVALSISLLCRGLVVSGFVLCGLVCFLLVMGLWVMVLLGGGSVSLGDYCRFLFFEDELFWVIFVCAWWVFGFWGLVVTGSWCCDWGYGFFGVFLLFLIVFWVFGLVVLMVVFVGELFFVV